MLLVGPPMPDKVKGDDPDKKGYPELPRSGLGVRLTIPSNKKKYC
jgi:hypothetical protein